MKCQLKLLSIDNFKAYIDCNLGGKLYNYELNSSTKINTFRNLLSACYWFDQVSVGQSNKKCGAFRFSSEKNAEEFKRVINESLLRINKKIEITNNKSLIQNNYWQPPDSLTLMNPSLPTNPLQQTAKVDRINQEPMMEKQITVHIDDKILNCITLLVYNLKNSVQKRFLISFEQDDKILFQHMFLNDQKFDKK